MPKTSSTNITSHTILMSEKRYLPIKYPHIHLVKHKCMQSVTFLVKLSQ